MYNFGPKFIFAKSSTTRHITVGSLAHLDPFQPMPEAVRANLLNERGMFCEGAWFVSELMNARSADLRCSLEAWSDF